MANKNHKLLRDNTDHQSVNQSAGSITLISERQAPEHPSVLMAYSISQHTGVYNPFQITLFTKTTAFKKKRKKKLQATRQLTPVYHVECLGSLLMVWGRVPSLHLLSVLLARRPNIATREVLKHSLTGDTEAFLLCCACNLPSNWWTCFLMWSPAVQSHKLTFFNLVNFGFCAGAVRQYIQHGAKFGPLCLQFFHRGE